MRTLIAVAALALGAAGTAAAQVHVSVAVGVVAPPVRAQVIVATPVPRVYRTVVVVGPRYHARYHHRRARIVAVEHVRWHKHKRHW